MVKIKLGGSGECEGREECPQLGAGWRTRNQCGSRWKTSRECVDGRRPSVSLSFSVLFNGDRLLVIQRFSENHNIAQLSYMSSEKGSFFWQCTVTWYEEPTSQTNSLLVLKKKNYNVNLYSRLDKQLLITPSSQGRRLFPFICRLVDICRALDFSDSTCFLLCLFQNCPGTGLANSGFFSPLGCIRGLGHIRSYGTTYLKL